MTRRELADEVSLALVCAQRRPAWRRTLVLHAHPYALALLERLVRDCAAERYV